MNKALPMCKLVTDQTRVNYATCTSHVMKHPKHGVNTFRVTPKDDKDTKGQPYTM
jgi:hypothetical protein